MSSDWMYLLSDFAGLSRMSAPSKQSPWTEDDLVPMSKVSNFSCRLEYNLTLVASTGTFSSTPLKEVLIGYRRNPRNGSNYEVAISSS